MFSIHLQLYHFLKFFAHSSPQHLSQADLDIDPWGYSVSQWRCQKVILSPLLCNLEVNFSGCSSLALWKSRQRSASSPSPNYHCHHHHHHHHYHRSSCSSRIFVRCLHLFVRTRLSPGYPQISACQHINTLSHYTTTTSISNIYSFRISDSFTQKDYFDFGT